MDRSPEQAAAGVEQIVSPAVAPAGAGAPSVSVIIPAYNAAATVGRTIESALAQTCPPLEILVIDDGSADATPAVVAGFGGKVRLIRKPNGGPASARNLGAAQARGQWLGMLDADDWWFPDKLERQLALDVSPHVAAIHCLAAHSRGRLPSEVTFADLWRSNLLINSSVLIRRSVFEELGGFDEARPLISVEDYNLWLRVAAAGWRILTCQEILIHYTRGIGLSSLSDRFLNASLYNLDTVSRRLEIPAARVQRKRQQILEDFGRSAFYERKLATARALFGRALRTRPTAGAALRLAASCLPTPALDVRRRVAAFAAKEDRRVPPSLFGCPVAPLQLGALGPYLLVVIDTEEEFDWASGPSRASSVRSMGRQTGAQRLFEKYRVVPTYAVDYAVASQQEGYRPLLDFLADGRCEIGAQLHPWLNPPMTEPLNTVNSFPGNLPHELEAEKIRVLTATIEENLGRRPILYRAGRFGLGPETAEILHALQFSIDCSVRPHFDLRSIGGPDFSAAPNSPFWFGPGNRILEIPVTVGMTGAMARAGGTVYPIMAGPVGQRARLPGILARANLLNRVQLTPEGSTLNEAKQLTREMLARDRNRVFVLSYHSPSLAPGNTPYVRSEEDLRRFLHWIEAYLDFFLTEIKGVASTPSAIRRLAERLG